MTRHVVHHTLELIRFSHTLFALPFALAAVWIAAKGWPGTRLFLLILLAMITARTTAMAFNRLVDRRFDALNPRTQNRPSVDGRLSPRYMAGLALLGALAFLLCCAMINPLAIGLAPIALCIICGYSLMKRYTSFSHLVLGAALGLAPIGAQVAVAGTITLPFLLLGCGVTCWVAGFDILYALADVDFDRAHGLHSIPARLGVVRALVVARGLHVCTIGAFAGFGLLVHLQAAYFLGCAVIGAALVVEHLLIRPTDLSRLNAAFFTVNGWISIVFLLGSVLA
ncbi:MAG: UbiA family prenyltransferase [Deltaproteobacteria bacterium]|nr:UbiA family prenyltransferase [Deltaproteobacteria bacterium]